MRKFWVVIFAAVAALNAAEALFNSNNTGFAAWFWWAWAGLYTVLAVWELARRPRRRRWTGIIGTESAPEGLSDPAIDAVRGGIGMMAERAGADPGELRWTRPEITRGEDGKTYWTIRAVETKRRGRRAAR